MSGKGRSWKDIVVQVPGEGTCRDGPGEGGRGIWLSYLEQVILY